MTVQNRDHVLPFGKATLESLDRLRRERNFRHEDDCGLASSENGANSLQINFRLPASGHAVEQNRPGLFRPNECFFDRAQSRRLLWIQREIGRSDKLLVAVWIARDRFLAQHDKPAFLQRAQRLVIERNLAQEVRGRDRLLQFRNGLEQFRLPRRAPAQSFDVVRVDCFRGTDKQLLLPTDFGPTNHLRQKSPDHRFNRAAIIGAHPAGQLDQLRTQDRLLADERFDRPNPLGVAFWQHRDNRAERRFFPKWNTHARADAHAVRKNVRHEIVELAMNGAIDDNAGVALFRNHCAKLIDRGEECMD